MDSLIQSDSIEPAGEQLAGFNHLMTRLSNILQPLKRVAIACSGGVDSTVLAAAAAQILGAEQVLAVTALAPMVPADDQRDVRSLQTLIGVTHHQVRLPDTLLDHPPFTNNTENRCYDCKKLIFQALLADAHAAGFNHLCDGTNDDDLGEVRPGLRALRELQIRSPLAEAGLTKKDIRLMAATLCPSVADKPAMACLATRIPTGTPVTKARMERIDRAESNLRQHHLGQVRVRDHHGLARVEIETSLLTSGISAELIIILRDCLKQAGFDYFTLDLEGYRTGSMAKGQK